MEDWSRLADHVIAARVRLGYKTRRAFAAHLRDIGHQVDERTLGNLERRKSVSADTVAAVEIGLDWEPGSGRAILEGGRPTLAVKLDDAGHAEDALTVEVRPEVPSYVDLEKVEDWEREIWTQLALLSPDDKHAVIEFVKIMRQRTAVGEGATQASRQRRAG
jgi:hypothetical protein